MQVVLAESILRALVANAVVYIKFTKCASVAKGTYAPVIEVRAEEGGKIQLNH